MVPKVGIVATEDEANTHRANIAGGLVSENYDFVLVSRDPVDVLNMPTIIVEFPSAPHKPMQLVQTNGNTT